MPIVDIPKSVRSNEESLQQRICRGASERDCTNTPQYMHTVKNVFFVGINDSIFCPHCSFVVSVALQSCLVFLIFSSPFAAGDVCAFFIFFCLAFLSLLCRFIVLASFYRFSLVLSFWPRFISTCVLIFSSFCSI